MADKAQDQKAQDLATQQMDKNPTRNNPRGTQQDGFRATGIYKVITTFTDSKGRRWQTDQNFPADDEAELKAAIDSGQVRADGEPQEYVGSQPTPPREPQQHQKSSMQNEQPRSAPHKSRV